jgi:tRNA1(Val) A37 N6-methylase TrmN6
VGANQDIDAHEMLAMAKVGPSDIVYDLGSGNGVILIEAAKKNSSSSC